MNDTNPWPVLGQAAASRVARNLARQACWTLAAMPADYGMPLAAFLKEEASALLIAVTDAALANAAAAMTQSLVETRSDGLIIANERAHWFPPIMALGRWTPGTISWHLPMLPWAGEDDSIWLVPGFDMSVGTDAAAFKLVARYLKPAPLPWTNEIERLAGLDRSVTLLRANPV